MAIRGPSGRPEGAPPTSPAVAREQPTSPTQRLVDFGMAKTPQEAVKVLKEILALLAGAGFPVAKTGSSEQQLSSSLATFQRDNNLPVTGKLDQGTLQKLQDKGLAPKNDAPLEQLGKQPPATNRDVVVNNQLPRPGFSLGLQRLGVGDAPAGSQKGRSLETDQAAARVDRQRPDVEVDLKGMLQSLREAGFAGAGKGKEQLQDAVKKLQRADGLPVTGKLDAKTAESLEKRGVLDSTSARALKEQDPTWAPPATTASSSADEQRLTRPDARNDADARGSVDGKDAKGATSRDDVDSAHRGRGSEGGAGSGSEVGADGRVAHGDVDGSSDNFGNNHTGDDDDDDDERRGRANVDDLFESDEPEHWSVPSLAEQIENALATIARDDNKSGAATYAWELHLHRPGIYSARQPAEELLKLVVSKANAFDQVWQQAVAGLNVRLQRYEPDADVVTMARLRQALQRARYREM